MEISYIKGYNQIYDFKTGMIFNSTEDKEQYYKSLNKFLDENDIFLNKTLNDELYNLLKKINFSFINKLETIPNLEIRNFIYRFSDCLLANNKYQNKEYESEDEIVNKLLKKHISIINIGTFKGYSYVYSEKELTKEEIKNINKFINMLILNHFALEKFLYEQRQIFYYVNEIFNVIEEVLKLLKESENMIGFKIDYFNMIKNNFSKFYRY